MALRMVAIPVSIAVRSRNGSGDGNKCSGHFVYLLSGEIMDTAARSVRKQGQFRALPGLPGAFFQDAENAVLQK